MVALCRIAVGLSVVAVLALAAPAGAAEGDMTFYPIPGDTSPYGITAGPDGRLWFANSGNNGPASVGRMGTDGSIAATDVIPLPTAELAAGIVTGPDGKLWVRQGTHVDRVPVDADQTSDITGFDAANSGSFGSITTGPDDRIWFSADNYVGAMTTAGDEDDYYSGYSDPFTQAVRAPVTGPDGKIWFANDLEIRRMTTSGVVGSGDVFPLGSGHQDVRDMTLGPDGNFWFTLATSEIGRLTPSGDFTFFDTPTASSLPTGIVTGADGKLWFGERNADAVASIPTDATSGADIKEYPLGGDPNAGMLYVAAGADNRVWAVLFNREQLVAVETGVAPPPPDNPGGTGPADTPPPTPPGPGPSPTPPGPSPPPSLPPVPPPAGCSPDKLILTDVFPSGGRTRILGVAPSSAAGKRVTIKSAWNGKRVAQPVVGDDLSFSASVPLPPRRLRTSNRTRYVAVLGGTKSQALKFARRMYTTAITASGRTVTFKGVVTKPLAKPAKPVVLRAAATCGAVSRGTVVATVKPSASGAFTASFALPSALESAPAVFLRAQTKVPKAVARRKKLFATFTLIRGIRTTARR